MGKERQVYCTFCGQTFTANDVETCSLCGKPGGLLDPMSPEALSDLVAKKRQQPVTTDQLAESLISGHRKTQRLRGLLGIVGGGVFLVVLGVCFILDPRFRADPRLLSVTDLLHGLGVAALGVGMFVTAFFIWRGPNRAGANDAEEKPGKQLSRNT